MSRDSKTLVRHGDDVTTARSLKNRFSVLVPSAIDAVAGRFIAISR